MGLGLERAGMKIIAFCEKGEIQKEILRRHWPDVHIFDDATKTEDIVSRIGTRTDVVAGGDPCPIRSRARGDRPTQHPDLSGYFLALVGRLRPRWVVRENVLASDDTDFATALGVLGYRTCIIRTDAAAITGQSRVRDFIVGCLEASRESFGKFIQKFENGAGTYPTSLKTKQVIPALTTHRARYDSRDCYIWEPENGLRILDCDERTAFAGFPAGWLDGISETACAKLCGNAIVPQISFLIGSAIINAEKYLSSIRERI